jgi:hypothetical protein
MGDQIPEDEKPEPEREEEQEKQEIQEKQDPKDEPCEPSSEVRFAFGPDGQYFFALSEGDRARYSS